MVTLHIPRSSGVWLGYHEAHLLSEDYTPAGSHDCAVWFGRGASVLGLPLGTAHLGHANKVFRNAHPLTGAPLRSKTSPVALFEFTYSAPKSFSLLTVFDDRLPGILMPSVHSALRVLECRVATRERKGRFHRSNATTPTNNLTALCVPNFTTRAGEPQAHVHVGVANLTLDDLPDVRSRIAEIENFFNETSGRVRLDWLHGHSRWWRKYSASARDQRIDDAFVSQLREISPD